ncbi:hypothetical protein C8F01DRAFT_1138400 [Mycena amicta]|nr:hypothetical protein C8F01DRAFT_1138400 [Mycena amicta]
MDVQTEDPSPIRCEGLWFSDCGLVIRAENTVFRVSRAFMAVHSPIFQDMLALPTPQDAETFEDCPLVRLPDSADDVTHFLKALIYHDFLSPDFRVNDNGLYVVAGILRLSHKYEVASLRKRVLAHSISALFPTTLVGLDDALKKYDYDSAAYSKLFGPSDVIILGRLLSLDWLLPVAFYEVCRAVTEAGVLNSDLSAQDKVRYIVGGRTLGDEEAGKILDFLWEPTESCEFRNSDKRCFDARIEARRKAEK